MKTRQYLLLLLIVSIFAPYESTSINIFRKKRTNEIAQEVYYVYKTRYNYTELIPVMLNDSKTEIVCMPTKENLKSADGRLSYPQPLSNGYFISKNIDLNQNIAFLNLTIEDYIKADKLPNAEDQIKYVKDFEPFRELYIFKCNKNSNPIEEVNKLITNNEIRQLPTPK